MSAGIAHQPFEAPLGALVRRVGARLVLILGLVSAILSLSLSAFAFVPPRLEGHVVDTAGALTEGEIRYLDGRLSGLRRSTGFEIVAFLPASLEGETIDDVAYETFNAWGIGRKGADNGVLLVIAPKERKIRIETGLGVGGALTDLQSNDIIREVIAPRLAQGRTAEAIDVGTRAIAKTLVEGTPANERPRPTASTRRPPSALSVGLGALGLVAVIVLAIVSPSFRAILWVILEMLLLFGGRGGGGGDSGSGYSGGGGRSRGGGSSDDY